MSPIVGTYTNSTFNAVLKITGADDSTGAISGTFTLGGTTWNVNGGWNSSTMSPGGAFYFTGGTGSPAVFIAGAGATPDINGFPNTNISVSLATKGGNVSVVKGYFVRS